MSLAVLTTKIKGISHQSTNQLRDVIRIFQLETILRWHRELVRRKWTYSTINTGGRPLISKELKNIILRLAQENPRWGYGKNQGELSKLSFEISQSTIRNELDRHGIQPASVRNGSIGWRHLMSHYKEQILACDFFTVETIWLQTIYVLFFIELGTVHIAGITTNPNEVWISQQATPSRCPSGRQVIWELQNNDRSLRFLIHDNDRKFSKVFDGFSSQKAFISSIPLFERQMQTRMLKAGFEPSGKNAWITS